MPKRHGLSSGPEYQSWRNMIQRCTNPNNARFSQYGGRGILVCEPWKDFLTFLADMGPRPSDTHSLDRIDNDKGYEPSNCRWATMIEQQHNRRPWGKSGFKGVNKARRKWAAYIQTGKKMRYLGLFNTAEEAGAAYQAAYDAEQKEKVAS